MGLKDFNAIEDSAESIDKMIDMMDSYNGDVNTFLENFLKKFQEYLGKLSEFLYDLTKINRQDKKSIKTEEFFNVLKHSKLTSAKMVSNMVSDKVTGLILKVSQLIQSKHLVTDKNIAKKVDNISKAVDKYFDVCSRINASYVELSRKIGADF